MGSSRRVRHARLGGERLEARLALDGDGGASATSWPAEPVAFVMPGVDGGDATGWPLAWPLAPGDADAAPDRPWIRRAAAADAGALVLRIRLGAAEAIDGVELLPLWWRANAPDVVDPLFVVDSTGEVPPPEELVDGVVFGGAGTDPRIAWPVSLDAFAATEPPAGISTAQDYYLVLESKSNLLLGLMAFVMVMGSEAGYVAEGEVTTTGAGLGAGPDGRPLLDMSGDAFGSAMNVGREGVVPYGGSLFQRRPPPPAPVVRLSHDTGASAEDRVTADGTLVVDAAAGARVEYSADDGRTWGTGPLPVEGARTILVRQVDGSGRISPTTPFTFTLDRTAPAAPRLRLADGTPPGAADPVRRSAAPAPRGVEPGARVEYSAGGGAWSATWPVVEGANAIRARQIDVAGNVSPPSAPLRFRIDSSAEAPTVRLANDTGWSATDLFTADATLTLGGLERGATVHYSTDAGHTWSPRFKPVDGMVVVLVRQTDALGNVSPATRFAFTLDRAPPPLPSSWATLCLPAASGRAAPAARSAGEWRFEYSVSGGAWTTTATAPQGRSWVRVRVVDRAGNVFNAPTALWAPNQRR